MGAGGACGSWAQLTPLRGVGKACKPVDASAPYLSGEIDANALKSRVSVCVEPLTAPSGGRQEPFSSWHSGHRHEITNILTKRIRKLL